MAALYSQGAMCLGSKAVLLPHTWLPFPQHQDRQEHVAVHPEQAWPLPLASGPQFPALGHGICSQVPEWNESARG